MTKKKTPPPPVKIVYNNDTAGWNWNRFHREMKKAGWERLSKTDPARVYVHSVTGRTFQPYRYTVEWGMEQWRLWAMEKQTPPPF